MSAPGPPSKVSLVSRDEVSISLAIENNDAPTNFYYKVEYQVPGQKWESPSSTLTEKGQNTVTLEDLMPTSTYEIRVYTVDIDSGLSSTVPSDTVAVDTDVPGCTSGPSCQCTIM